MPVSKKFMGIGRSQVKAIATSAGSTSFAGLTDVDVTGAPQGSVLYYNGSQWVDLAPATANQVLTTNGAGANPSWTNKTSATGIVGGTDRMVQFNDGGSTFGGVAFFEFQKLTNNLMVSGSAGYSYSARASGSSQTTSGLDVFNYDNSQVLQVGHNNATTESYIWATQTSNNLKFGTNNIKRMEILASNGKIFTTNDFHVSGTLTAGTPTLIGTDTLWTQKGDLAVGTGSDTAQRLASAAGDNGQVLTIDTGETTGLKWADPGGVEVIARYHVPVASASTGATGSRYVSSPIRIDPVGGDWEDGNVVITDDPGVGTVSTTGLGKLSLISQTGSSMLGVAASGAATTIAKFGSITNHTSTIQFLHNGYSDADILSKIVMTSGTTTIGAESPHKFILTGGLGITAQSSKPTDSTTKPAIWVSGTSNLLYLSDVGMVTANSSVLSAGYVPYVSGAAKNGVGNSVLYNDATNSRIGINTASPNRAFDVRGTSLLSGNTKVVGTGEITSTLDVGSNITGTGTATFKTASLTNIVLDPTTRAAFIKLQDSSRTTTTASRNPEILLNQVLVDSGSDKADFPTIRFTKGGPVAADASYTNLGYRIYVSGETGAGTVNAPQAMIWDFNSDIADPANYIEKLALTTTGGLRINNAYTLPTAVAGSNGYVITGNTDGTTGWAAQSGGGGGATFWSEGASSKIYYNSGNVGIGTTDPGHKLDVRGDVNVSGTLYMENGWELDGTSATDFELDNGGTLKYRFNNGRFQTVHAGTAAAPTLVDNNDTTTGIYYPSTSDWAVSTDGTLALYVGASQGVGLGTDEINTRQGEGLTISGTNITDTWSDTDTKRKPTSLFIPSLTSGAYVLAGVGGKDSGMAGGRAEPPYMIIGASEQTILHNNAMNSGRAVSLVLAGTAGYNSGGTDYGNFGSLIFHGNSNWSGNARRWLVSNAWRNSGAGDMGLGFAGGTNSAALDPTISGSTPSVVMSTDSNYGTTDGTGGLLVGNTSHIGGGRLTVKAGAPFGGHEAPQMTLAYDGSNYTTFNTDSSGVLTISGATTVTYPPFQVLPGGGVRIDRYTKLSRDTSSNGLNVDDGAGNAVPINVKGVMAGNGYFADPDVGEIQMYSYDNSDGDSTGKVTFNSRDSGGSYEQYAFISGTIHDATATEEAGQLDIGTLVDGTSTPTMTIVSGNVGIGTASPNEKLEVAGGNIRLDDGQKITFGGTTTEIDSAGNDLRLDAADDVHINPQNEILFFQASSEKMRLKSGNLGIGTTAPDAKLDVLSTTEQLRLTHTDASKYMSTAVDSAGSTTWTNQKSFRFTGATTSGSMQIDQNKISLVRDATSAASNVLQIGDGGTYDQFSIVEDQRGSTATNGYIKLRAKKTGNFGYRKVSLNAISGSNTSELFIDSISTNEALRFDTETKTHALDIAKAGYVSIGASVTTTDTLYVNGNTTINGVLSATAKSFDIPHPDKEGKRLVHGSLEGPEHGVYARGTAKGHGETTIELPDYWKTLVGDDYTLQLTSYNSSNIYIVEKEATSFTINSNSLNYKFDYVVIGRREEIEVEQNGN